MHHHPWPAARTASRTLLNAGRFLPLFRALALLALGAGGLVERSAETSCQLQRIIDGPEMEEEQPRLFVEHVTVDRRNIDAIGAQRPDYRIDFVTRQYKVSGNRRLAAAGRLEVAGLRYP